MTQVIRLASTIDCSWVETQEGKYIDHRHFDTKYLFSRESVDVYKPDGSPLFLFRPGALSTDVCERARSAFRKIGSRYSPKRGLHSGIVGYYDKPTCRRAEFNARDLEGFAQCLPFIRACNDVFRRENPKLQSRYAAQRSIAYATAPSFRIEGTAFTTGTANLWDESHDGRTRVHKDKGDLPAGFGVISVLSRGEYDGGYLIFPAYRVAVDLRTSDVLLADVHEYHANAPIVGGEGWERIAVILYYLTALRDCERHSPVPR